MSEGINSRYDEGNEHEGSSGSSFQDSSFRDSSLSRIEDARLRIGERGPRSGNVRSRSIFEDARSRLLSISHRMLGSRAEAEDIVQEAYLKWHALDASTLRTPVAWLTTVVTRLSIDRLRRLQLERLADQRAVEPATDDFVPSPETLMVRTSEFSRGLSLLVERLSPEERAALVLHEAFDCSYSEIGLVLSKTAQACRQIVHRAKTRLRAENEEGLRGQDEKGMRQDSNRLRQDPNLREDQDRVRKVPSRLHAPGQRGDPAVTLSPVSPSRLPLKNLPEIPRKGHISRTPQRSETGYLRGSGAEVPTHLLAQLRAAIESQDKEAFLGLVVADFQAVAVTPESESRFTGTQTTIAQTSACPSGSLSGASFAELLMKRASTGEVAEATQLNGRCGLALMNGSEAVAILYVEARGEWIARCYLTTLSGHLSTVNRVPAPHLEWANEVGIVRREAVVG